MLDIVKVAVDAMGGDNAPGEIVKGCVSALEESKDIYIYLVGRESILEDELSKYSYPKERLSVVNADEVIETAEPPVIAIRKKKESRQPSVGRI